ncbi:pyroglutamylated RF-amide peptide receptor-like [Haliotis rubra]|uniref:pyroglutamylated RF-amide peptide receptor-like n=1 Tax=Haliotis rubra TaxID=36100 RepID=UPI001EE4F163|nr:pyroglutamylated RF-amide peptide receptor-like [Haliotis rubra]
MSNSSCEETGHVSGPNFIQLYPSIVFFCVLLLVVGIPGNGLILYIYTKKINIPIISFFIKVLAILNLVCTSCLLPALVLFKSNIKEELFCKWFAVGQHVFLINTGVIYVTIAIQRYRKMCTVNQSQINASTAKKILLGCVLFSVTTCFPHMFLLRVTRANVKFRCVSQVPYCGYEQTYLYTHIYITWMLLELCVVVVTLVVLYSLIGKHIAAHKRQMSRYPVSEGQGHTKLSNPTGMFFTLTMIFLLSVAPRIGMAIYTRQTITNATYPQSVHHLRDVIIMLPFINCVSNPFVYVFTSKVFRMHVVSLFCAERRIESTSPPSITIRTQESVL